ncbi:MAG: alpha/beta hydrolase [Bacteroidales bacterium]|nr:alpha/beta hydrolase [Bacteroidales bacterium]MCF8388195.1 alpha/beta hydrolase [Bacteroidales bacterium]MCF8399028.1 alpha/beta hydrolase [Bacteroidales bacterium]
MNTTNYKKHGTPPFQIILVHGGPGAIGDLNPLARRLGESFGVIETLHYAKSIDGQINEIKDAIITDGKTPVKLVGHSWGAWLCYIYASHYPEHVNKLIMLSSGTFNPELRDHIAVTRNRRLKSIDFEKFRQLQKQLSSKEASIRNNAFCEMGNMLVKLDSYEIQKGMNYQTACRHDVFKGVYPEADELRNSGALIRMGHQINCPVVAIHGDYDPHPREGIEDPLKKILRNFDFYSIEKCGHYPWLEKYSSETFYKILKKKLA